MFACKVFGCKETEKSGLIYFVYDRLLQITCRTMYRNDRTSKVQHVCCWTFEVPVEVLGISPYILNSSLFKGGLITMHVGEGLRETTRNII